MLDSKFVSLAFDPGLKHTGVAISFEGRLAVPLETVHHQNPSRFFKRVNDLVALHKPELIIIGQPHSGPLKSYAQKLSQKLSRKYHIKICLHPEDLSSREATHKLIQSGRSKTTRNRIKHASAAALILQDYLDSATIK